MKRGAEEAKPRVLVAKPSADTHWFGALLICRALRDAGLEAIYTGLFQTPEMIVTSALQEDVDVIALSMQTGQHVDVCSEVVRLLAEKGAHDISVVAGGIIPDADKPLLERIGVTGNYGPGTSLGIIVNHIMDRALLRRAAR